MTPEELAGDRSEEKIRFVLFCTTCHKILMELSTDEFSNPILARIAKTTSLNHSRAYHEPHPVDLIDNKTQTGTTFSAKRQLFLVSEGQLIHLKGHGVNKSLQ